MKKTLLAIALATTGFAVLSTSSFAADAAYNGGYFINGGVGRTEVNKSPFDTNDTGYTLNGGYRWGLFGVEIGYTDLGSYKQNVPVVNTPVGPNAGTQVVTSANVKAKVHGPTLGGNVHIPVGDNFYVSGRAGIYHFNGEAQVPSGVIDSTGNAVILRTSTDGYKPYGGVGVGYDFSSNVSLGVNYDYYSAKKSDFDLSSKMLSVNAEYRF